MLEATFNFEPLLFAAADAAPSVAGGGSLVHELERRQDEVLCQLEALNERILSVLRKYGGVELEQQAKSLAADLGAAAPSRAA